MSSGAPDSSADVGFADEGPDAVVPVIAAAIVGAQKCGTTTLAAVLARHPSICLAAGKEAHLFDRPEVQSRGPTTAEVTAAFPDRHRGQLLLDATPSYLYLPGCIEALVRHSPDVRLIVILRSPAERAVSHHRHERRLGHERLPFLAALALERRRLRRDTTPLADRSAHRHASYVDRGRYVDQLERLTSLTQLLHVLYVRDLIESPERTIDGVHDFLGIERLSDYDLPHLNAGDGRRRRLATAVARAVTRRDRLRSEAALGLPAGFLR